MTKTELSQVIVQALYCRKELPPPTDKRVVAMAKHSPKDHLIYQHGLAKNVLLDLNEKGKLR